MSNSKIDVVLLSFRIMQVFFSKLISQYPPLFQILYYLDQVHVHPLRVSVLVHLCDARGRPCLCRPQYEL